MAGRFEGRQALVLGVANKRSIAWAIAERLAAEGAQLAFTYQGERIEKSVRDLAATVDTKLVTACDVRSDEDLDRLFAETAEAFGGGLDVLVHSVAFAAAEDLEGRFTDTPRASKASTSSREGGCGRSRTRSTMHKNPSGSVFDAWN